MVNNLIVLFEDAKLVPFEKIDVEEFLGKEKIKIYCLPVYQRNLL